MVFKVRYITQSKIQHIYVFSPFDDDLNKLYRDEPNNSLFTTLLSEDERQHNITFVNEFIHFDDSIDIVKKKIMSAVKCSFSEVYIFGIKETYLTTDAIYEELTQNETTTITQSRLYDFLLNISDFDVQQLESKEIYDYDDILALDIKSEQLMLIPIGLEYNLQKQYPFTVNPFNIVTIDKILEDYAQDIVSTQNRNLVLDYGNLVGDTIYLCQAEDVFTFAKDNNIREEIISKIYFPYLYKANIKTGAQLLQQKQTLMEEHKQELNEGYKRNNTNIDLLYNVFYQRTNNIDYINKGIKSVFMIIHPHSQIKMPIDVLFKIVHATETMPLIKFNPGRRDENIYRLYADRISESGKKIPMLGRTKMGKLSLNIAKTRSIGMVINTGADEYLIEFYQNGDISIRVTLKDALSKDEIVVSIRSVVNPLFDIINTFFEQSGYKIAHFTGFTETVEVIDLRYVSYLTISKNINIERYMGCLSSVFTLIEPDLDKDILMDFKRVAYFNKMDDIERFITQRIQKKVSVEEVIPELRSNFNISEEEAKTKVSNWLSNVQLQQNLYENRKLKLRTSSGFVVKITRDKFSNNVLISVEGINNIGYLKTIPIYLDTLIRLTQTPESTRISQNTISSICKGKSEVETVPVIDIGDTIKDIEETTPIENNVITFTDDETNDDLLDMLYGDISDDDEFADLELGEEIIIGTQQEEKEDTEDELEDASEDEREKDEPEATSSLIVPTQKQEDIPSVDKLKQEEEDILRRDITGLNLNHPNYFFERMHRRDPKLFLKSKEGKFNAFSRLCPHNLRRQPVILTPEEKERIDKESPGSYEEALGPYGSEPNKQFYYICPRYWCLKDNISLTYEDILKGKCGGVDAILPYGATKVTKGKYIYEFNSGTRNNEHINVNTGEYQTHNPQFLKEGTHPDGLCIPCCFKAPWREMNEKGELVLKDDRHKARREVCLKPSAVKKPAVQHASAFYVKGTNKFPLRSDAYGYPQIAVQKVLGIDSAECQISSTNKNIKRKHPCLLRKGVEHSRKQSFIACIADIYGKSKTPSITQMKEIILKKLTLEIYIELQNGTLVDTFYQEGVEVDIEKYINSNIARRLGKPLTIKKEKYLRKCVNSFENFKSYINDDDVLIDYTYLWDFVSKYLFNIHVNLLILRISEDDITDNIDIICPSNHYSSVYLNLNEPIIIMITKNDYFEPIYQMTYDNTININTKFFNINKLDKNLAIALTDIKEYLLKCSPLPSMPKVYTFKSNIYADDVMNIIKDASGYTVTGQVLNYNNQIIALIIKDPTEVQGYLPIQPGAIIRSIPIRTFSSRIWNDYVTTRDFLLSLYNKFKFPCRPLIKVIEDGLIVGIITQTNQFVSISVPTENIYEDELQTYNGLNETNVDKKTLLSTERDEKRIKSVKRIKLETQFFNAFRSMVRSLLNSHDKYRIREKIENTVDSHELYLDKLKYIMKELKELTKQRVQFINYDEEELYLLDRISSCSDPETCNDYAYCETKGGICALRIPKYHLISGRDNELIYLARVADELLRYDNIRDYLLSYSTLLSLGQNNYKLNKTEIIIPESVLFTTYFDNVTIKPINPYVRHSIYNTTFPSISQITYDNTVTETVEPAVEVPPPSKTCQTTVKDIIPTEVWFKYLPRGSKKIETVESAECIGNLILSVFNNFTGLQATLSELKSILADIYVSQSKFETIILTTLRLQGKKKLLEKVGTEGGPTLSEVIMSNEYYFTNLDIIELAKKYKIPILMISSRKLKENNEDCFTINYNPENVFYYIIKQRAIYTNIPQRYELIQTSEDLIRFVYNDLPLDLKEKISKNSLGPYHFHKRRLVKKSEA